jgi:hypothetical protein
MTALAPHLAAFLREHLPRERQASPHTCETYAYSSWSGSRRAGSRSSLAGSSSSSWMRR